MRSLCPLLYLGGAATCMVRSSSWTSSRSGITGISGGEKEPQHLPDGSDNI